MAQSRLEKIGTIYTRTQSLLRGGAMKAEDKPLWYLIYEAFPPKYEPRYDRPAPITPIREIFYKEDTIRAKFQKEHKTFLSSNLSNAKAVSTTQRFLAIYEEMEKQQNGTPEEELYSKALEVYRMQVESFALSIKEAAKSGYKETKNDNITVERTKVDLKKVFDD